MKKEKIRDTQEYELYPGPGYMGPRGLSIPMVDWVLINGLIDNLPRNLNDESIEVKTVRFWYVEGNGANVKLELNYIRDETDEEYSKRIEELRQIVLKEKKLTEELDKKKMSGNLNDVINYLIDVRDSLKEIGANDIKISYENRSDYMTNVFAIVQYSATENMKDKIRKLGSFGKLMEYFISKKENK